MATAKTKACATTSFNRLIIIDLSPQYQLGLLWIKKSYKQTPFILFEQYKILMVLVSIIAKAIKAWHFKHSVCLRAL